MQKVSFSQATLESSLLNLRQMHCSYGSSLPLGQQLRRLLQLKVLPLVPRLCLPRICPRSRPHGLAGNRLHGLKLPSVLCNFDYRDYSCLLLRRSALRTLCCYHVCRPDSVHH